MINIIKYESGANFVSDNQEFLDKNKYMATFFYYDAKIINKIDENNYLLKVVDDNKKLLAMKVEPYDLMLYGNYECLDFLINYLKDNYHSYNKVLCSTEIGDKLVDSHNYKLKIGMDFMETTNVSEKSCSDICIASKDDADSLAAYCNDFLVECGLDGKTTKEDIIKNINKFRLIKVNGEIVSFAKMSEPSDGAIRISYVYTKPSFRGMGYARKVVNSIKNEIIEKGFIAALNVDRANPISNHLYSSLGFKKIFSQGIYEYDKYKVAPVKKSKRNYNSKNLSGEDIDLLRDNKKKSENRSICDTHEDGA